MKANPVIPPETLDIIKLDVQAAAEQKLAAAAGYPAAAWAERICPVLPGQQDQPLL